MLKRTPFDAEQATVVLKARKQRLAEDSAKVKEDKARRLEAKKKLRPKLPTTANTIARGALSRVIGEKRHKKLSRRKQYLPRPVATEGVCLVAVKTQTKYKAPKSVLKELNKLNLRAAYAAVLLPNTSEWVLRLRQLGTEVVYGTICIETLRKLLVSRGTIKCVEVKAAKTEDAGDEASTEIVSRPLDNARVETVLGEEFGFLCVEDLVAEYADATSPRIEALNKHINPFQLDRQAKLDHVLSSFNSGVVQNMDELVLSIC